MLVRAALDGPAIAELPDLLPAALLAGTGLPRPPWTLVTELKNDFDGQARRAGRGQD